MTIRQQASVRVLATLATAALVTVGLWGAPAPASADVPADPAGQFVAPLCAGETLDDPTNAEGTVENLALVFGARLDDYNAGKVVPLYDTFGLNELNGYPAVCGTRYVDGVGPVSEWMFCTDYFSHVCSGVDAEGNLVDIDGVPIPGMDSLPGANAKLSADQEKLIAYLVQHGHATFDGVGYFEFGGTSRAVADGGSFERAALQILVWCISDPVAAEPTGAEIDRAATCEANMNAETQASILADLPDDPTLVVEGPEVALEAGQPAEFTVTTDVFTSPLAVSATGAAGSLAVLSGPGTLDGTSLTVTGAGEPVSVVLAYTSTEAGTVTLDIVATPSAISHIGWNQSPGVSLDGRPCQVFATFHVADQVVLTGAASATFLADGGTDGGTGGGTDGGTGGGTDGGTGGGTDGGTGGGTDGGTGGGTDGGTDTGTGGSAGAGSSGSNDQTSLAATGGEPVGAVVLIAAFAAVFAGAILATRKRRSTAGTVAHQD